MKNHDILRKVENFVLGKGFYIALAVCALAIGVSTYALIHTAVPEPAKPVPVKGGAVVEVPDPLPAKPVLPTQPPVPAKPAPKVQPVRPKQPEAEPEQVRKPVVYTWPLNGAVMREFTMETLALDPTMGDWRTHRGVDIAAALGTNVLSVGEGRVTGIYEEALLGTVVVVEHPDGLASAYCGLQPEPMVVAGDLVSAGTVLGQVGESCIAESGMEPHLHLETWFAGEPVNPMDYLPER